MRYVWRWLACGVSFRPTSIPGLAPCCEAGCRGVNGPGPSASLDVGRAHARHIPRISVAKARDARKVLQTQLIVEHALALSASQAEHADLAEMRVVVHVVAGLPRLRQRIAAAEDRVRAARTAELVGGPALAVVGEVRAD